MQLSAEELKLIERMRQMERLRRKTRWFLLIGSIVLILGWGFNFLFIMHLADLPEDAQTQLTAYLLPPLYLLLAMCALILGYTLAFWNGDPKARLLLRLLEEHEKPDGKS